MSDARSDADARDADARDAGSRADATEPFDSEEVDDIAADTSFPVAADGEIADQTDTEPGETLGGRGDDDTTSASKDPDDWVTGDEPMTGPQRSYLDTLAREAGEELPVDLSKAQASIEIDRLQQQTGRGQ